MGSNDGRHSGGALGHKGLAVPGTLAELWVAGNGQGEGFLNFRSFSEALPEKLGERISGSALPTSLPVSVNGTGRGVCVTVCRAWWVSARRLQVPAR
jgi:hypothetical protein